MSALDRIDYVAADLEGDLVQRMAEFMVREMEEYLAKVALFHAEYGE